MDRKIFRFISDLILPPTERGLRNGLGRKKTDILSIYFNVYFNVRNFRGHKISRVGQFVACTKPYYLDVADDSRVCYVEVIFSSRVICKRLHDEVQCLHYDVSK